MRSASVCRADQILWVGLGSVKGVTCTYHGGLAVQAGELLVDETLCILACQERHRILLVLAQCQDVLRCAAVPRSPAPHRNQQV